MQVRKCENVRDFRFGVGTLAAFKRTMDVQVLYRCLAYRKHLRARGMVISFFLFYYILSMIVICSPLLRFHENALSLQMVVFLRVVLTKQLSLKIRRHYHSG